MGGKGEEPQTKTKSVGKQTKASQKLNKRRKQKIEVRNFRF